jgi:hypothetical protein
MILVPAMFPFCVQISPPIIGCVAMFTMVVDRSIQSCLRLFDGMLASLPVIGVHQRRRHK